MSARQNYHQSVAMQEVQERRDQKHVPGGLKLHQYANLYFHARNPMLYKRKGEVANLCVLRISTEVRHIVGVVMTDRNASSDYVRFLHPSQGSVLDYRWIGDIRMTKLLTTTTVRGNVPKSSSRTASSRDT
jgi:hypothetical protein